jgi:hypothetical protein
MTEAIEVSKRAHRKIMPLLRVAEAVIYRAEEGTPQERWALRGIADDARAAIKNLKEET